MGKIELYNEYDLNKTLNEIKSVEKIDDFIDVISVFRSAPYFEVLDEEECEKEFESYKDNGLALGYYVDGKIAGINCVLFDNPEQHSIKFSDNDKIAYYSGFAVKSEFRKRGIGSELLIYTDDYLESLNYFDYAYARILLQGSMSEKIFANNGFEDVYVDGELIVDEVEYVRNNSFDVGKDKRKYMAKKYNPNGKQITKRR